MSFRILIADDEPLIRSDLKEILVEKGYFVVGEAKDGLEAKNMIDRIKPDVIVVDIKMPKMDGIELAELFAKNYPVIILTAFSEHNLIENAKNAGVMSYLTKPFRENDISPAIELAVSNFLEKSTLTEKVTSLKDQLDTRKLVDRAKGVLMAKMHFSEKRAYRHIQKLSMDKNIQMKDVAELIIAENR